MQITEVTTITRANTDIVWTSDLPADPNDPFIANLDKTYTITVVVSDDLLTKTRTRIWSDQQAFIDCHVYSNVTIDSAYAAINVTPGITYSKTITTVV
jgi:hypothetical protein